MEKNIKFQLEELKKLFEAKSITESEYDLLKEEILFKKNNIQDIIPKNNESNQYKGESLTEKNKPLINIRQKEKNNNSIVYIIVFFLFIGFCIFKSKDNHNNYDSNSINDTINSSEDINDSSSYNSSTICKICGIKFSGDGYDRIDGTWQKNTSMQTELCSPSCAREQSEKMDKTYDDILEKHGYQKVFTEKCSRCSGDFVEGFCERCGAASAEKVNETYSNMPNCEMCSGTGVSDGYDGKRICSVCNGKGKQTY
jgi:hypothetical protein